MFSYHPTFAAPAFLALLLLLPLLWWFGYRRLAGLGRFRRWFALLFRAALVVLLVLAAADTQIVRRSETLTVIYLLDQSLSIPQRQRAAMTRYVTEEVRAHRRDKDRAGVIVFGSDAAIERPAWDGDFQSLDRIESAVDSQATNIAAALKLAQATFLEDSARRIVLVTDGNQNQGNAVQQAQAVAAAGIGIDVAPVRYHSRAEVTVERVILPSSVRRNEPFDLRVVLSNNCDVNPRFNGNVPGKLSVTRIVDDQPVGKPWEQHVVLPPGKSVFSSTQKIDSANFYTYEAKFAPDRPEDDAMPQNNRATAFTHVAGKGQVLAIVSSERDKEHQHDLLAERLRQQGLEVLVRPTDRLFSSLAELQVFDTIVLANVPRATSEAVSFSDEQIDMFIRNTQQMGAGLVMLGGPDSFGAGGWAGTGLEKAMPVDFRIHNATVVPGGALVMVIDKSGSMAGPKIAMCKAAAMEAAKVLGPRDYVGVVAFDVEASWIVPMRRNDDPGAVARGISRLGGSGGTNMEPGILEGYHALQNVQASVKHMILLTDGDTLGSGYPQLAERMHREGITVTGVAVGEDADRNLIQAISNAGGGKYYFVNSPKAIPRIFQREARKVTRSLVYEDKGGIPLKQKSIHEMLAGIDELPPIKGYVLTSKKDNPLVETVLFAAKPGGEENATVLAGWNYGLGRAVAFTTDDGLRWTSDWPNRPVYDKLFGQIIRWSMRPSGNTGKFTTTFEPQEGRMCVVVAALDNKDEFLNFLTMTGTAVGPDLKNPIPLELEQTAPGRYAGSFAVHEPGSYFVTINPGRGMAPLRTGVTVPYSAEFRDRGPNEALLSQLATIVPKDGPPGMMIENKESPESPLSSESLAKLHAVNTFRHDLPKASSSQEVWHWLLLLASGVFLADVFVRRVSVTFDWLPPLARRPLDFVLRRAPAPAQPQYIERLKSRKAEVAGQLEQLRAATRFEMPERTPADAAPLEELSPPPAAPPGGQRPSISPEQAEESYTERLLKAKKKAMEDRDA
jgi:Mg-chelatase subunit ChlD